MLTLKQIDDAIATGKLSPRTLVAMQELRKQHLAKSPRYGTDVTHQLVEGRVGGGDIRYNPAHNSKKHGCAITAAGKTQFVPVADIDPDTGEYVAFDDLQTRVYERSLKEGMSKVQALLRARSVLGHKLT